MSAPGIERTDLAGHLRQIGHGNFGIVYLVEGFQFLEYPHPMAYKEFKATPHARDVRALRHLIQLRDDMAPTDRSTLERMFCWPLRTVIHSGDVVGFLMPAIPDQYFYDRVGRGGKPSRRERTIDQLATEPTLALSNGLPVITTDDQLTRIRLCRSAAVAFEFLHARNLVLGDFSYANALWSTNPTAQMYFIDCDAIRTLSDPDRGLANSIAWHCPEHLHGTADPRLQDHRTDAYKLGLFILRCMAPIADGLQQVDPAALGSGLDSTGAAMLTAALAADPDGRPTAGEWHEYLSNYIVELTSPPRIDSIDLSATVVLGGADVTAVWSARGADSVTLQWTDGALVHHLAAHDPGSHTAPVWTSGHISLTAQNRHGAVRRVSPVVWTVELPPVERLVVPVPDFDTAQLRAVAAMGAIVHELAAVLTHIPPVHVRLPALPAAVGSGGINTGLIVPGAPLLETAAPDVLAHVAAFTAPRLHIELPSIDIDVSVDSRDWSGSPRNPGRRRRRRRWWWVRT